MHCPNCSANRVTTVAPDHRECRRCGWLKVRSTVITPPDITNYSILVKLEEMTERLRLLERLAIGK